MKLEELVKKIEEFEGFRATPYLCPSGVLTIGFGRTEDVYLEEHTTRELEEKWLTNKVEILYKHIMKTLTDFGYTLNNNQYLALTDFIYNLGRSSILQLTDYGSRNELIIGSKILEYNKARVNGELKELAGLTKRREWERDLFFTPCTDYTIQDIQRLVNEVIVEHSLDIVLLDTDNILGEKTKSSIIKCLKELL